MIKIWEEGQEGQFWEELVVLPSYERPGEFGRSGFWSLCQEEFQFCEQDVQRKIGLIFCWPT
jgi:hypothetical protein